MTSYHVHMPLSAAYRMMNGSRAEKEQVKRVLGFDSLRDLRRDLDAMIVKGMQHIPSENCDHDQTGACPGHEGANK